MKKRDLFNYIRRYGVGQTFRTILRKVGVIKSKGFAADNLPIMKYCQNLTPEQYPKALSGTDMQSGKN